MNYASLRKMDITNGPGIRVSLFVSGCNHHCFNCFNPETWDFNYGFEYTIETEQEILKLLQKPHIRGLSLLGGDPLWQNQKGLIELIDLCKKVHDIKKDIWLWTGFTWEEILSPFLNGIETNYRKELIYNCDVIVDGRFIENLKDLQLEWKGSTNQRVIDVKKTLQQGDIVLWDKN